MKCAKSLTYLSLATIFGLLQLILAWSWAALDTTKTFKFKEFILECGLSFFCSALVTGLSLDYFFRIKNIKNPGKVAIAYILYPLLILGIGIIAYADCVLGAPDYKIILKLQIIMLLMSLIYCFVVKATEFSKS